ncbi:MAG: HupE/UreJ family protein [Hymenobacter sp.]|nr:MAG: HupE/UreJ family protein [Hymenobacter sp.]
MPNSLVLLTVHPQRLEAELHLPLGELQFAFQHPVADSPRTVLPHYGPALRRYLAQHFRVQSPDGRYWVLQVGGLRVQHQQNQLSGPWDELVADLTLRPPAGADIRRFVLRDDAVLHQVVTHKILVAVRQDWATGRVAQADSAAAQVGVIQMDVVNSVIPPLAVNLTQGSAWTGFVSMVKLGTRHIAEGTDHLLFLLVLLLPAPLLLAVGRRWGHYGGMRYSLRRLLGLVSAFTVGHSLTLALGTLGWVQLPQQPVEALIAVSILVAAVHAVRPVFPGREVWVAAGFGLVHGLAFATTLAGLHLEAGPLALSLLGFNLGIELMQLAVVAGTVPWLLLLAQTPTYGYVRLGGAVLAGVAATAWLTERLSGQPNALAAAVTRAADYAPWLLAALAIAAVWRYRQHQRSPPEPGT